MVPVLGESLAGGNLILNGFGISGLIVRWKNTQEAGSSISLGPTSSKDLFSVIKDEGSWFGMKTRALISANTQDSIPS